MVPTKADLHITVCVNLGTPIFRGTLWKNKVNQRQLIAAFVFFFFVCLYKVKNRL